MAAGSSLAVLERTERVSPELVLVDPALAERARSQLADPEDTVARLEALAREAAVTAAARRLAEQDSLAGRERRTFPRRTLARRRSLTRRHPVLVGGFATVTVTMALLLGMGADPGGTPTAFTTPAVLQPPVTAAPETPPPAAAPATRPKATPATPPPQAAPAKKPSGRRAKTPATSRPAARPFAWAPSPGASGYHVELYRGAERVFAADTKKPAIEVPANWSFAGRSRSLSPGEYRWYVWPVVGGKRSETATVQASLTVG
jgi:hypothetical protein